MVVLHSYSGLVRSRLQRGSWFLLKLQIAFEFGLSSACPLYRPALRMSFAYDSSRRRAESQM